MTPLEKRRVARKLAMPEVKKLVRRFGRSTIAACVNQLKEHEKAMKRIDALRKEAARLQRTL